MPKVLDSSTVTVPSLPTLSMASAMTSPIDASAAEIVATWAIWLLSVDRLALGVDRLDGRLDGLLDAALETRRVRAGRDVAQTFLDEGLGEDRRGRRAVTGHVVGLGGDFLHQLGAHVLERVLELDLASDRHTVVGDGRGAELLADDHVAALGPQGHLDGVGELVDAGLEAATGLFVKLQ